MARAVVLQSGGPTTVINESLVGIIRQILENQQLGRSSIDELFGSMHGPEGIINDEYIPLLNIPSDELDLIGDTPGAYLGSSRLKIGYKKEEADIPPEQIVDALIKQDVHYLFIIGGNDTADNAKAIRDIAKDRNYELIVEHVAKTVDNDLMEGEFSPGFLSAATYTGLHSLGLNLDHKSLPGVLLNLTMGRNNGSLVGSGALGRQYEGDGPHRIFFPEIPFDEETFVREVTEAKRTYGRAFINVSEGIRYGEDKDSTVIKRIVKDAKSDGHKNVELTNNSSRLLAYLTNLVREGVPGVSRTREEIGGYAQRSFPGVYSLVDKNIARALGREAVNNAEGYLIQSVVVGKNSKGNFVPRNVELEAVAKHTRKLDRSFISEDGFDVSQAYLNHFGPLIGKIPKTARADLLGMVKLSK